MGLFDAIEDPLSEVSDALSDLGLGDAANGIDDATRMVQAAIDRNGGLPAPRYRFLLGTDWGSTVPVDAVGWEDAIAQAGRVADNLLLSELREDRNFGGLAATALNQSLGEEKHHERTIHQIVDFEIEEGLNRIWQARVTLTKPCQLMANMNVATGPGSERKNLLNEVKQAFGYEGDGTDLADLGTLAADVMRGWRTPDALASDLSDVEDPDLIEYTRLPYDHVSAPTLAKDYIGQLARFSVARRVGANLYTLNERWFTGRVIAFEDLGGNAQAQRQFRLTVVPHLFELTLRRRYRVFRNKNVVEILTQILDEHGIYPKDPGDTGVTVRRYAPGGKDLFGPIGVPDALGAAVDSIAGAVPFGLADGAKEAIDGVLEESIEDWRPTREYCVQYGETDLEFVERLLAEEGLTYFFEHRERRETLVVCEDPRLAGKKVLTAGRLPLDVGTGQPPANQLRNNELAWDVAVARRPVPSGVTLRDRSYARPYDPMDLKAGESPEMLSPSGLSALTTAGGLAQMANQVVGLASELAGAPGTEDYAGPEAQWFEWPARLAFPPAEGDPVAYSNYDGPPMAKLRLDAFRATGAVARGKSDCATLSPGGHVRFVHQPFDVLHDAVQKPQRMMVTWVKHTLTTTNNQSTYFNEFEAQSPTIAYRPPAPSTRPRIRGVQTAIVIDVSGEVSVKPEESAWRIRVRFPWEREADKDGEEGSRWLRFAQPFSGAGFGALFVPRVGMEVVVGFEDGDPDRPYVVGALYAAPYEAAAGARHPSVARPEDTNAGRISHAARMTESGITSHAWPQDEQGEEARQNRFRFDDHANKERIAIFAQYDLAEEVGRDHVTSVQQKQENLVTGNQREKVGGDQTLVVRHASEGEQDFARVVSVGGDETIEIGGGSADAPGSLTETIAKSDSLEIGGNRTLRIEGKAETITITGEGASETKPGRLMKVIGDSSVEIEGNDEIVVTGDRRVKAQGPYDVIAKKIDLKTPVTSPDGGGGPAEETGSLQIGEEGVSLESKGAASIECDHLDAHADRIVIKAATRLSVRANGHEMVLESTGGTISFVAAAGTSLRMGNDGAHIELKTESFALVADASSWKTESVGDGATSTLDSPGQVKLSATDEIDVNAPSIVLGEPGEG